MPRTTGAPTRAAQTSSCSPAAARKVSPAPSRTEWPAAWSLAASFPMVVVLPEPFTPTTMTTHGRASPTSSGRAAPSAAPSSARMRAISSRSAPFRRSASASSLRFTFSRADSRSFVAVFTPMSAVKSTSSSSASTASSTGFPPEKRVFRRAMKPPRVFSRPAASVRPASAWALRRRSSSSRRRASSASRAARSAASRARRSSSSRSWRRRSFSSRSASFLRAVLLPLAGLLGLAREAGLLGGRGRGRGAGGARRGRARARAAAGRGLASGAGGGTAPRGRSSFLGRGGRRRPGPGPRRRSSRSTATARRSSRTTTTAMPIASSLVRSKGKASGRKGGSGKA